MRFSFFTVLFGLAALAVVNALPAENPGVDAPAEVKPTEDFSICCKIVSLAS